MGCCGDREKGLANVAADQKWDYIVCSACGYCVLHVDHVLTRSEPLRLPVLVLPDALFLYVAVDPHPYLLRRLRR